MTHTRFVIAFVLLTSGQFLALSTQTAAAAPVTAAFLDGELNEPFAGTESLANRTFTGVSVTGDAFAVTATLTNSARTVTVVLKPQTGASLAPGAYMATTQDGDAAHPGLAVSRTGVACAAASGLFTVDDLAFDAGGAPARLSVRFEHHCEGADPSLFGAISFNSSSPYRERFFDRNSMAWGSAPIGAFSQDRYPGFANRGPATDQVTSYSIQGADAGSFEIIDTAWCPTVPVSPNFASCSVHTRFRPAGSPGFKTAKLTFFDEFLPVGSSGRDIVLTGMASTSAIAYFQSEAPNGTATSLDAGKPFSFSKVTTWPSFGGLDLEDTRPLNSGGFELEIRPPTGMPLAPGTYESGVGGASLFFGIRSSNFCYGGRFIIDEISFHPTGNVESLSLRVESHNCSYVNAYFAAVRIDGAAPFHTHLAPISQDFGTIPVGDSSERQMTVTNNGLNALAFGVAGFTGANASDFSLLSDTCSNQTLAPAATCTYGVRFTSSGARGPRSARLTFFDDFAPTGGSGWSVVLSAGVGTMGSFLDSEPGEYIGNGQQITMDVVTFGGIRGTSTLMFRASAPAADIEYNIWFRPREDGQALTVGVYEDAQRSDFREPGHPGFDIFGEGRGCTPIGRFIIDEAIYNASGQPTSFSARFEFQCEGLEPRAFGAISYYAAAPYRTRTISPDRLEFERVLTGQSASRTISITNHGPASLNPSDGLIEGLDADAFSVTGGSCGISLGVGDSCTFVVTFQPQAPGVPCAFRFATLRFFDEIAPLSGAGRQIELVGLQGKAGAPSRRESCWPWASSPVRRAVTAGSGSLAGLEVSTEGALLAPASPGVPTSVTPEAPPAVGVRADPRFTG